MPDSYEDLAIALKSDGIYCQFQSAGKLVVSRQVGPIWPNRGNSFWVTQAADRWYLFTWSPTGYGIPEVAAVASVCRACMDSCTSAMSEVPAAIVQEFGLVELSEEEMVAVFRVMDKDLEA